MLFDIQGIEADYARAVADDGDLSVGKRVRVNAVSGHERVGVIVEDFGDAPGCAVTVGDVHIAEPSRRWAVHSTTATSSSPTAWTSKTRRNELIGPRPGIELNAAIWTLPGR